ncbi:olfactory receptor 52M1-like [Python bivittatus]|uniref:Olfactory receptor 52M1-like n=1 Tax=Python bivittatus TaxID=176946 RepID=A0A9F2RDA0_PYTBI|nr:olfactory receptor 52M1-like [Python bivittatus]
MTPAFYNACLSPSTFFLTGIPQLEAVHAWLSLPFGSLYIMAVLGNCTILFLIKAEPGLHQPMYLFLSMLAVTDLVLSSSTLPKLLAIFWFDHKEIGFHSCLLQMFVIHSFATVESGIFLAMAYDRYVAICAPLRHRAILTHSAVVKIGATALLRGFLYISPLPLLARRLTRYHTNIIAHSYCEHMAVAMLSCEDTSISNIYGMVIGFLILIIDSLGIGVSYVLILRAVMNLDTAEARLKSFSTCSSHICAILAFYVPIAVSSLIHRFGHQVSPPAHILLANFYLIFPPVLNPIVYTARSKEMQRKLANTLSWARRQARRLL